MLTSHARITVMLTTVVLLFAGPATADFIPLTGDPIALDIIQGQEPFTVGDKCFTDFEVFGSASGGAVVLSASDLYIQGGQDTGTGDYGLRFITSMNAGQNQTVNTNLSFRVSVGCVVIQDPTFGGDEVLLPNPWLIKDVSMLLTGASANGSGIVNASEAVFDGPVPGGSLLAGLSVSKQFGDGGVNIYDRAEFAPVTSIWVRKDISLTGGADEGGAAHLSEFFQFYSQVPEPVSLLTLTMGGVALMLKRRRA